MASNSVGSLLFGTNGTDGYLVNSSPNNSFVSMWCDKRSATHVSLSLTILDSNAGDGYVPAGDGYVEVSNAPENPYVTYGSGPLVLPGQVDPPDTQVLTGATVFVISALGTYHWDLITAHRWVRVRFTGTSVIPTLTAYVFASVPFESC